MNAMTVTPQFTFLGIFFGLVFIAGIVAILYRLNTGIRRGMKKTHDDRRIEDELEAGDTLHAEGIYGSRHPEEGGLPLRQEHDGVDVLPKTGLRTQPPEESEIGGRNTPYYGDKI